MGSGRWETKDLVLDGGVELDRPENVVDEAVDTLKVTLLGSAVDDNSALPRALALATFSMLSLRHSSLVSIRPELRMSEYMSVPVSGPEVGAGVVDVVDEVGDTEVSCWTDSCSRPGVVGVLGVVGGTGSCSGGSSQQDSVNELSTSMNRPGSPTARRSSV